MDTTRQDLKLVRQFQSSVLGMTRTQVGVPAVVQGTFYSKEIVYILRWELIKIVFLTTPQRIVVAVNQAMS